MGTATTWDEASTPGALDAVARFEADRDAGRSVDPRRYVDGDRPGQLLALLRVDMFGRRRAGAAIHVETYLDEHPNLDEDARVALIYEEFCLREEEGDAPTPPEYYERFPTLENRLRRILAIHGLVGDLPSTASHMSETPAVPFPEAGQTIAGFHLVEELGRGSFARVYLAHERQLADRPVALKVSRTASREPQTLARLQHTNIVPVHSCRVDPATGLHLLCMPFFGRVTLSTLLADEAVKRARAGASLVEALDRHGPNDPAPAARSAGRAALAERPFARAIAWWGASLAEALHFAHERGVAHRDVKPSNVLVTREGTPMLLDFNLAMEARGDDPAGGTLAYMAPEHLDALAAGAGDAVDGRADVYSLGVVLFEAMGARPFAPPAAGARSLGEALRAEADRRRRGAPALLDIFPEAPPPLGAVIDRCLAADPADRYATAAMLAADLRAVADAAPLRHARLPLPGRVGVFARRHRRRLASAIALGLAVYLAAMTLDRARMRQARRLGAVRALLTFADRSFAAGDLDGAESGLDVIQRLAQAEGTAGRLDPWAAWPVLARLTRSTEVEALRADARGRARLVAESRRARTRADALIEVVPRLHAGLGRDFPATSAAIRATLAPFAVLSQADWPEQPDLALLDPARRDRLVAAVDDLLFAWVAAAEPIDDAAVVLGARALCDRGSTAPELAPTWAALAMRLDARLTGAPAPVMAFPSPSSVQTPRACDRWLLLSSCSGRPTRPWVDRAEALEPASFARQATLAALDEIEGRHAHALEHHARALALRPGSTEAAAGVSRTRDQLARSASSDGRADRPEPSRQCPP